MGPDAYYFFLCDNIFLPVPTIGTTHRQYYVAHHILSICAYFLMTNHSYLAAICGARCCCWGMPLVMLILSMQCAELPSITNLN